MRRLILLAFLAFLLSACSYEGSPTQIACDDESDCPSDWVCFDGLCADLDELEECGEDELICGMSCADPMVDPDHCGSCFDPCSGGEVCSAGSCLESCPGGEEVCGGGCVDTETSLQHCGGCDAACAVVGGSASCVAGVCQRSCPAGLTVCGDTCVDTQTSAGHCGQCGVVCTADGVENGFAVCIEGSCGVECAAGFELCDGVCVDVQNDDENCGSCGNACELTSCGAGVCQPLDCAEDHGGTLGGGSGSAADPFTICTREHLEGVEDAMGLGVHFALSGDLDLAGEPFSRLGSFDEPFEGIFDGFGYRIQNLTIDGGDEVGLFGAIAASSEVRRLGIEGAVVSGNQRVGILAGINRGFVSNVTVEGTVNGGTETGGLVGRSTIGGRIQDSSSDVFVSSTGGRTGGLVGQNYGTIERSLSAGFVQSTTSQIGGLVGVNSVINESAGLIINAESLATVVGGNEEAGGLAGRNDTDARIESSHAYGNVSVANERAGGLVGYNRSIIRDSSAAGGVTAGGRRAGGLVGFNQGNSVETCRVERSFATGTVVGGGEETGGLIGRHEECRVEASFATGMVQAPGQERSGGLIGRMSSSSEVADTYAMGTVFARRRVGGLVGHLDSGSVTRSYSWGFVISTDNSDVGGLVGEAGSVSNSYWNLQTSGQSSSNGDEEGLTTEAFGQEASFSGWDFTTVWNMSSVEGRPILQWQQ